MRLIKNRKIVDAIEAYDQNIERLKVINEVEIEMFLYNERLSAKLFDIKSLLKEKHSSKSPSLMSDRSALIHINLSYINEYINDLLNYSYVVKGNTFLFSETKQKALDLIQLIKKEYYL